MRNLHILTIAAMTAISATAQTLKYPSAPKTDVVDEYFGIRVSDPYRQLENDTSEITENWVKAENAVTQDFLSKIPFRKDIKNRL